MPGFTANGGFGGHTYLNGGIVAGGTPANTDFYYNYMWEVGIILNDVVGLSKAVVVLKDCSLPEVTVEQDKVKGTFTEYKYAKGVSFSDIKMTFYDASGLLGKLMTWMNSIYDPDSGLNVAVNYKSDSAIQVSLPDGSWNSRQVYYLYGSWPSSIKYGDLTYTSSDVKVVDLGLTYDFFRTGYAANFTR